jgi:Fe-S-cluster containining protein
MPIELLKQLRSILKRYDNICPRRCWLCEHNETLMLLPNEELLISLDSQLISHFARHADGFYYLDMGIQCPYFITTDSNGKCLAYDERPIDCRIFPFYPDFNLKNNSYTLLKSELYCPLSKTDLSEMEYDVRKVLDEVNKFAPNSWKLLYNKLNYQRVKEKQSCC